MGGSTAFAAVQVPLEAATFPLFPSVLGAEDLRASDKTFPVKGAQLQNKQEQILGTWPTSGCAPQASSFETKASLQPQNKENGSNVEFPPS